MAFASKARFIMGFFFLVSSCGFAQDQNLADSLIYVYKSASFNKKNELGIIKQIAENEQNPENKLEFSKLLIDKAAKTDSLDYLLSGYLQQGHSLRDMGNNLEALQSYFKSLNFANEIADDRKRGALLVAIADTYSIMDDTLNAQRYYRESIEIQRRVNDPVQLASALLNAGDEFFNDVQYEEALNYFKESAAIFDSINYEPGIAYNLGNVGMVYAELGKDDLARKNLNLAIEMLEKLEDLYPVSVYLLYVSDIYLREDNLEKAMETAERSRQLSLQYGLKDQISEANLRLSELNKSSGDFKNAYLNYIDYVAYRDSVKNIKSVRQMANLRANYEVSQKQSEIDLLAQRQRTQKIIVFAISLALLLILIIAVGLYRRNKFIKRTSAIIRKEKDRSDQLLLNILPEETAQELKDFGRVKSKRFESVTVLFTDFKDFTHYSDSLPPEILVESVDFYFSRFDEIMEKYDLEKIKTIGDCYMCAGGIPFPTKDHAQRVALAAFEIAEFVKSAHESTNGKYVKFQSRIGINTGPVVAGVVGSKKFAYDIWGDTVNIASRMESNSEPDHINISQNTYDLIKDDFDCEYRGEVDVKNKGRMKMYYLKGVKINSEIHLGLKAENRLFTEL